MSNDFVYDNVALPADKINRAGNADPVANPTKKWSANDAVRVFAALTSLRSALQAQGLNVKKYGAVGDGVANDAPAINAALTALSATVSGGFGGWVDFPKGTYRCESQIIIPNGCGLRGASGATTPAVVLKAASSFSGASLVRNQSQAGTQEYAFLQNLIIDGNKGGGATCTTAVVDWVSLFVNSYIDNCIIQEGSNVGLRVAADGTPGGMGPVLVSNCWVARNNGHNVLVEDTVANTGAATGVVFLNLTTENQGANKSAIYLKGNGRLAGVRFIGTTHIEMGVGAVTGKTGVTFDGCAHTAIENLQLLANAASVAEGVNILNVVSNVGIKIEHIYNPNLIGTVIRDQKNSVTLGAVNVNNYVTGDWTYQGGPKYRPATGGKSIVFQNDSGTDVLWMDDKGRVTGASQNGSGLDVRSDATNDRPLTMTNTALDRVFGFYFPSGGGGVLRHRYFTGGLDVYQVGTDGSMFFYEAATMQKTSIFQSGFRLTSEVAPASIGANQNDYNPTGMSGAATLLLTSSGAFNITGFATGTTGRMLWVFNNGANNIVLTHQDAASAAANRIICRGGANMTLTPSTGASLYYSPSLSRWLAVGDTL